MMRIPLLSVLCLLGSGLLTGCSVLHPEALTPLLSYEIRSGTEPGCAALLLPGRFDRMGIFRQHGFDRAAQEEAPALTVVETDAHVGYYRERSILDRLAQDVLEPTVAEHGPTWLVGISMGGIGSIGTAARSPDRVAGLVLLAPFLGKEKLVEEIRAAGGIGAWDPGEIADKDFGRRTWAELQGLLADDLPVYLGFGEADDLSPGHRLLAEALPADRVFTRPGGHDWDVWSSLWGEVLSSADLCTRSPVINRADR